MAIADAVEESLAIPGQVRAAVDARDGTHCRVCGKWLGERRALHHVIYGGDSRGMGGRRVHNPDEIITVCWQPGDNDCHLRVHSDKGVWQPLLLQLCQRPGVTGLQLIRWNRAQERKAQR